jgi:hypothetical protein
MLESALTPENMIGTVYGDEVSTLMNAGWTLDIENSMLLAPEALGAAEGFEAADLLVLLLFF